MTKKEKIKDILERFAEFYEHADYRNIDDLENRFADEIIELFLTKSLERDEYGNVPRYRPRLLTRDKSDK